MKNADSTLILGVVGIGAMGQGIAQVAAQGGLTVKLVDARAGGAQAGRERVVARLDRLVEKERLSQREATEAADALQVVSAVSDLGDCDVVVEAVFEDVELKRQLLAELEAVLRDDAVIASNTSSILISSLSRDCQHRHRIAGMHFFNPVPLMKLVEIVRTFDTSDATVEFLQRLGEQMGRVPVVVKDSPGFLVNLGGRAYTTEAARLLQERVASPAVIDAIMRDCCGFRMGPLELMDLTGVDVNFPVSQIIYNSYFHDPRLKTSFPHRALLESGRLGRKSGQGNYRYDDKGRPVDSDDGSAESTQPAARQVALVEPDSTLDMFVAESDCQVIDDDGQCPLLVAPIGEDATHVASRLGVDHRRLIAVDLACDTARRVTLMTAPGVDRTIRDAVVSLIIATGRRVSIINDSPGFVSQRIRAMIANLGCEMAQMAVASPEDIDRAMELGLNYPLGPMKLTNAMGASSVLTVLTELQAITGDDRYRPSLWLKRRALLGLDASLMDPVD